MTGWPTMSASALATSRLVWSRMPPGELGATMCMALVALKTSPWLCADSGKANDTAASTGAPS